MTNVGLFRFQNRDPRGSASFGRPIIAGRLNQGAWEPEHSGFVGGRKMKSVARSLSGLVAAICVGSLAIGQEVSMSAVVEGNSQFALDLYGTLRDQPGNLFFSPSSISTALAMTYAGARGETAQQMARVLSFPVPQEQLPQAFRSPGQLLQVRARAAGPSTERCQPPLGAGGLPHSARLPGDHPQVLSRRACPG